MGVHTEVRRGAESSQENGRGLATLRNALFTRRRGGN